MHVSFVPYGERGCVERVLREMEAQKHILPMTKGKKNGTISIGGQIRLLPFGIIEYVFPKESLDMVLRTLGNNVGEYGINFKRPIMALLRKGLKLKKVPKYEKEGKVYLWNKAFVNFTILGIREDGEIIGDYPDDKGWTHEAL